MFLYISLREKLYIFFPILSLSLSLLFFFFQSTLFLSRLKCVWSVFFSLLICITLLYCCNTMHNAIHTMLSTLHILSLFVCIAYAQRYRNCGKMLLSNIKITYSCWMVLENVSKQNLNEHSVVSLHCCACFCI